MKYLAVIAVLGSMSVYAQNFSPSASGSSISSPAASTIGAPSAIGTQGAGTTLNSPNSTFNTAPVGTGSVPNNNFNTAPTNVPTGQPADTTLMNGTNAIPSNNPTIQAQEYNAPSGSGSFGTGSGVGTGMGSDVPMNGTSPISNP